MRFSFAEGRSGSVASANDGTLSAKTPQNSDAFDAYVVDYSTTYGEYSRWIAITWPHDYPDMRLNLPSAGVIKKV